MMRREAVGVFDATSYPRGYSRSPWRAAAGLSFLDGIIRRIARGELRERRILP